jgi:hypothetical protein
MINNRTVLVATAVGLFLPVALHALAQPAKAVAGIPPGYIAFQARFDGDSPLTLKGRVVEINWSEPYVEVMVRQTASDQLYKLIAARPDLTPPELKARLRVGAEITVRGYNAKDRSCSQFCLASARDFTFEDGFEVFAQTMPGMNPVLSPVAH